MYVNCTPLQFACLTEALVAAQMAVDDIETLNYDDLSAVAHLAASDRYSSIMQVCGPAAACCLHQQNFSRPAVENIHHAVNIPWQASWQLAMLCCSCWPKR